MEIARAREIIDRKFVGQPGSVFGSARGLALGMGVFVDGVEFPFFDEVADKFRVQLGLVYILSHECDLEPSNVRLLNGSALVCPVLPLEAVLRAAEEAQTSDAHLESFLSQVAVRAIARCFYLPPLPQYFENGAVLNLNDIAATSIKRLEAGTKVAALSHASLYGLHAAISSHLLRQKSDPLPNAYARHDIGRTIAG